MWNVVVGMREKGGDAKRFGGLGVGINASQRPAVGTHDAAGQRLREGGTIMNLLERHDVLQERINTLREENSKRIAAQAKAEDEYHCNYMLYSMRMNGFRADAADFDRRWREVVVELDVVSRELIMAVAGKGEG